LTRCCNDDGLRSVPLAFEQSETSEKLAKS
jgi:hypothetical protein